jgi:hypothetical protein
MLSEKYIVKLTFYKMRVLNNDSQQFQNYQQNEQSPQFTEHKKETWPPNYQWKRLMNVILKGTSSGTNITKICLN